MKVLITVLAVVALGLASPTPRRLFHRHYDDFLDTLYKESGEEIEAVIQKFYGCDDYWASMDFLQSSKATILLSNLIYSAEFEAVNEFLEKNNIDMYYIIGYEMKFRASARQRSTCSVEGKSDFTASIEAIMKVFPREELAALYEKKIAEDETFKNTMESFKSEEWKELYSTLRKSRAFKMLADAYQQNGIDVDVYFNLIKMYFGQ